MKRKVIVSLIALVCLLAGMSVVSQAETYSGSCGDNLTWNLDTNTGILKITGTGEMKYFGSDNAAPWYANNSEIKSIVMNDGITKISMFAFSYCSNLTHVTIPESVQIIGASAFRGCYNLEQINWNAKSVADYTSPSSHTVFFKCGQKGDGIKIIFGDNVESIPKYAFYCYSFEAGESPKITSVVMGKGIKSIGYRAFDESNGLKTVYYKGTSTDWSNISIDEKNTALTNAGKVYNYGQVLSLTLNKSLIEMNIETEETLIANVSAGLDADTSVRWSTNNEEVATVDENGKVTAVSRGYAAITATTVSGGLTKTCNVVVRAEDDCGENCTWTLDEETGVLTISGTGAMENYPSCVYVPWYSSRSKIKSVVIENGVTSIGDYAFYDCTGLTNTTIPDSVTDIGDRAFCNCSSLTSITIPDSVTSIGISAFYECSSLTSVTIPDNVTEISDRAFCDCTGLTSVTIGDSVTEIGDDAFYRCTGLTSVTIPDSVTSIGDYAFSDCHGLTSVIIGDGVTSIYSDAFSYCSSLTSVTVGGNVTSIGNSAFEYCSELKYMYYRGSLSEWGKISIGKYNTTLTNANRMYNAVFVNIKDESGLDLCNGYVDSTKFSFTDFDKVGYTTHYYTDAELSNEYIVGETATEDVTLYKTYTINQYTYKFVDWDGTVIKEATVDYGSTIILPENPVKEATAQYTYTFDKWAGLDEDRTQKAETMVFTATYTAVTNSYTYKFTDEDGSLILEKTAKYGSVITPPEKPHDKDPYTFDYWDGYTDNMTVEQDALFTAVYKYKDYTVTAEGEEFTVTYNSDFVITPAEKDGYVFIGYFTGKDGLGEKITDEKGESLEPYSVVGNLSVYAYFEHELLGNVSVTGDTEAMIGDTNLKAFVNFATEYEVANFICTVKVPEGLTVKDIKAKDFVTAIIDSESVVDGYRCITLIGFYDYEGSFVPKNELVTPFVLELDVSVNAAVGEVVIDLEDVLLMGNETYMPEVVESLTMEIMPKTAESITIVDEGNNCYSATVLPDYTTDKSVEWSVSDESVAAIDENGKLTALKNGIITIRATAKDTSGVYAEKHVDVTAYAKVDTIEISEGVLGEAFDSGIYDYVLYVPEDAESISINATYKNGIMWLNGLNIWISGQSKSVTLDKDEVVFTLNREKATDMEDSIYTFTVKKVNIAGIMSSDKSSVKVVGFDIEEGSRVVLAAYREDMLISMQSAPYTENLSFDLPEGYDNIRIMVWNSLDGMKPLFEKTTVE